MREFAKRAGFTMVEVLIIVGVVAVASRASLLLLDGYVTHRNVDLTVKEIEAVITDVRQRSIAQQGGLQWGIRFVNASSTYYYQVFSGPSFASGTVQARVNLQSRVKFGMPGPSSTVTALFEAITGNLAEPLSITIVPKRLDTYVGIINLSALGRAGREVYEDMVMYLKFDEGTGSTTADATGINASLWGDDVNHLNNHPLVWASGSMCKLGSCLSFDGYYLEGLVDIPVIFDQFTVMGWAKLDANGNYGAFLSGIEGSMTWIDTGFQASTRKPQFRNYDNEALGANDNLDIGTWYHMAYVYDGATKYIYQDGVLLTSLARPGLKFSLDSVNIARSQLQENYLYTGHFDEIKFYKKALTVQEVLSEYNKLK